MSSRPPDALTSVRFRRDVKTFLSALFGYLVVVVLVLVLLTQRHLTAFEDATRARWATAADVLSMSLSGDGAASTGEDTVVRASVWRGRYDIQGIMIRSRNGSTTTIGTIPSRVHLERRNVPGAEITFAFNAHGIDDARRRLFLVVSICVGSVIAAGIFLIAYLPRIVRPIERMLEDARQLDHVAPNDARDEAQYLIETFRGTIEKMKEQEVELKRLHDSQKSRADDLERVTATLTRSLTSGFLALDPQCRLVDMNASAGEILRLPADMTVQGRTLAEVIGETPLATLLMDAVRTRSPMMRVETVHRASDTVTIIGLTAVPLWNDSDEFLGTIALFTDLTPFRRLEAQIVEAQTLASVGEIAAGIAHEFRNSLSSILGYIKLARRETLPEAAVGRLNAAEEEARSLSGAVEGLLNFARPFHLDLQPVELGPLVERLVERLSGEKADIDISVRGEPFALQGDPSLLSRALENVLRNSADAIDRRGGGGGRIEVVYGDPALRTLTVVDNGVGVDPETSSRFFLPFQSDSPNGFGLGLALTKKIVLLHGGTIELTGQRGAGATVTIHLPIVQREPLA